MAKTMTVEQVMNILSTYPGHMPVFFYDVDKEQDSCVEIVELAGPISDIEESGSVVWNTPYYCKGNSNIEEYWGENGMCPILCLRGKTAWEQAEDAEIFTIMGKENN